MSNIKIILLGCLALFIASCFQQEDSKVETKDESKSSLIKEKRFFVALDVIGDVVYSENDTIIPINKLKVNTRLYENAVIETGQESTVKLQMDDGSIFTIKENSRFEIGKLTTSATTADPDAKKTKITLSVGELLFNIKKLSKGSSLDMNTYTAVASVRGTRGGIGSSGYGSFFYLDEGKLELQHKGVTKAKSILKANEVAEQTKSNFKVKKIPAKTEKSSTAVLNNIRKRVFSTNSSNSVIKNLKAPDLLNKILNDKSGSYREKIIKELSGSSQSGIKENLIKNVSGSSKSKITKKLAKNLSGNKTDIKRNLKKEATQYKEDKVSQAKTKSKSVVDKSLDKAADKATKNIKNKAAKRVVESAKKRVSTKSKKKIDKTTDDLKKKLSDKFSF